MKHIIQNDILTVTFKEKGAELCSLKDNSKGLEYIWQADPEVWGRHAPILFPIVGKLENDTYKLRNNSYKLSQHGFARNMNFNVIHKESDKVSFELLSSSDTLLLYPDFFRLVVTYTLQEDTLLINYEVTNRDDKEIFFSIGGHPGFTCPLHTDEKREDYYLEFETKETAISHILEGGSIGTRTKVVLDDSDILPITNDLFDEDALIFKSLKSEKITLKNKSAQAILSVSFPNFPYLGIWSKNRTAPFICIEPWFGIADNKGGQDDLSQKEGILSLGREESFSCEYSIQIH